MATIKNPPIIATGAGTRRIANGILREYYAQSGKIDANVFIKVNDGNKIEAASSSIVDGITQTECTESNSGKVWVYAGS